MSAQKKITFFMRNNPSVPQLGKIIPADHKSGPLALQKFQSALELTHARLKAGVSRVFQFKNLFGLNICEPCLYLKVG